MKLGVCTELCWKAFDFHDINTPFSFYFFLRYISDCGSLVEVDRSSLQEMLCGKYW